MGNAFINVNNDEIIMLHLSIGIFQWWRRRIKQSFGYTLSRRVVGPGVEQRECKARVLFRCCYFRLCRLGHALLYYRYVVSFTQRGLLRTGNKAHRYTCASTHVSLNRFVLLLLCIVLSYKYEIVA